MCGNNNCGFGDDWCWIILLIIVVIFICFWWN